MPIRPLLPTGNLRLNGRSSGRFGFSAAIPGQNKSGLILDQTASFNQKSQATR